MGDGQALHRKLQLDSGSHWLSGTLTVGDEGRPLEAPCNVDTPRQLVQAARAAVAGHSGNATWDQEPGGAAWPTSARGIASLRSATGSRDR